MYKVIVVGTDGSDRAGIAVAHAIALAKMSGAQLHAVQVVHPGVNSGFSDSSGGQAEIETLRAQVEATRSKVLAEAKESGVNAEVHNPDGADVADALIDVAETVQADLIVIGNRGMSSMTRVLLGNVPNTVTHRSPCSVLIVDTEPA